MPSQRRGRKKGGRLRRNNSPGINVNSNSLQDNTQSQNMQLDQQLPQQQAAMRQQQQKMHQPQTQQQQHQLDPQPIHQPQYVQPNCIIRPSQHPQCPLALPVDANQIQQTIVNTPVSEDDSGFTRVLVLRENGEQRLVTFSLPKEKSATIQDILQETGITVPPDSKIECTETSLPGINYLASVGTQTHENSPGIQFSPDNKIECTETSLPGITYLASVGTQTHENSPAIQFSPDSNIECTETSFPGINYFASVGTQINENSSLEDMVPGKLAVCNYCGYTSKKFNRSFLRCKYKFPGNVKTRPTLNSCATTSKKPDVLKSLQAKQDKKTSSMKDSNCPMSEITVVFSSDEEEES